MGDVAVIDRGATDADLDVLRTTVRGFLADAAPEPVVRHLMATETGHDPRLWRRMAEELGLQGLLVAPHLGGAGARWTAMSTVLEEVGAALLPGPFLSTAVLALGVLDPCDGEEVEDWRRRLATGRTIAAVVVPLGDATTVQVTADGHEGDVRLEAPPTTVLDAAAADVLFVVADHPAGARLVAVDVADPSITIEPVRTLDLTRAQARVTFRGCRGRVLGDGHAALGVVRRRLHMALAAEQTGIVRVSLERSVAHAGTREQFGRPIGAFQAIRHRCAQMLVEHERARSALEQAAAALADELPTVDEDVAVAAAVCGEAAAWVTAETIQVHGGVGFTWEHPAHLAYRRARGNRLLTGTTATLRHRAARALLHRTAPRTGP